MTTLPQSTPTPRRPNARTFEGRQRQRIHAIKRTLGYSESEYCTMLMPLTNTLYALSLSARTAARGPTWLAASRRAAHAILA
jgi:hypothetical protein